MAEPTRHNIGYPYQGMSENYGFSIQEELTSRDERNMRALDPVTGRVRGAQRAGIGVYANGDVITADKKVKMIATTANNKVQLDYAADTSPDAIHDYQFPGGDACVDIARDDYGNFYMLSQAGRIVVLNEELGEIATTELPAEALLNVAPLGYYGDTTYAPPLPTCITVDPYLNIYVGTGNGNQTSPDSCAIYCFGLMGDDTYIHSWMHRTYRYVEDLEYKDNALYSLTTGPTGKGSSGTGNIVVLIGSCTWTTSSKKINLELGGDIAVVPEPGDKVYVSATGGTDALYEVHSVEMGASPFIKLTTQFNGSDLTAREFTVTLEPEYLNVKLIRYLATNAGMIGPHGEDGTSVVVEGKTKVVFDATAKTITFTGGIGYWPGIRPRAGNTITVSGANKALNNGNFVVTSSTKTTIFCAGATFEDEVESDHISVKLWGAFLGGSTMDPQMALALPKSFVERKTPTITVTDAAWSKDLATGTAQHVLHYGRMAVADEGSVYITVAAEDSSFVQTLGYLAKVTMSDGEAISAASKEIYNQGAASDHAGIGYEVLIGKLGATTIMPTIITCGNTIGSNSVEAHMRKWVDAPAATAFDGSGSDTWERELDSAGSPTQWQVATAGGGRLRVAQDKDGGLYVPWGRGASGSTYYEKDLIFVSDDNATIVAYDLAGVDSTAIMCAGVAIYDLPDYSGSSAAPVTQDWVILGGTEGTSSQASVYLHSLTSITQVVQSPRELYTIALAAGTIERVPSSGNLVSIAVATGTEPIDATAPYVQSAVMAGKIYITDGRNYFKYDPSVGANGTLSDLRSTAYGHIPKRCRLIESWRGRLVLARDPNDPSSWHMSRVFDPENWDNFPQNPGAGDAISSRNSRSGGIPEAINTIIPYNDDLLLFGCDQGIWRLTGDPRAGGQIDLISGQTGISYGRPWCKDPVGALWFFGSEGGLYRMSANGQMENLSVGRVGQSLRDIDLGSNYVSLVWNYLDEGVHIFVIPFADYGSAGWGTLHDHWFFDAKSGGFHKDRFGVTSADKIQPTAAVTVNGDLPNDRSIMMGCEDGRIRRWGRDASGGIPIDDEQTTSANIAIDSYVTMGPLVPVNPHGAAQVTEFSALLGDAQDGCNFEFFSSDNPEVMGNAKATGSLEAGRNARRLVRVSGDSIFLRMRNASAGQRWAYETGSMNIDGSGPYRRV